MSIMFIKVHSNVVMLIRTKETTLCVHLTAVISRSVYISSSTSASSMCMLHMCTNMSCLRLCRLNSDRSCVFSFSMSCSRTSPARRASPSCVTSLLSRSSSSLSALSSSGEISARSVISFGRGWFAFDCRCANACGAAVVDAGTEE